MLALALLLVFRPSPPTHSNRPACRPVTGHQRRPPAGLAVPGQRPAGRSGLALRHASQRPSLCRPPQCAPRGQVSIRVRIAAGSLHEQPHELGWAHLVEHLAFRGSANFADREARHIWQQFGASFGSDTNAFTGTTQTFYQLDLPNADRAKLDRSLHVMADMMSSPLFDPPRSRPSGRS
jgi:hypothetical protein